MNDNVLTIPSHLKDIADKIIPILKQNGVKRAGIFGSFATRMQRPDSDVDILIDYPKGKTLFDLGGLYYDLEETLHRKVDLVEYQHIKKRYRDGILSEEIRIL